MSSESAPHVVYSIASPDQLIQCDNYAEAYAAWKTLHHYSTPYLIKNSLGRVIDPSREIVDVSE